MTKKMKAKAFRRTSTMAKALSIPRRRIIRKNKTEKKYDAGR